MLRLATWMMVTVSVGPQMLASQYTHTVNTQTVHTSVQFDIGFQIHQLYTHIHTESVPMLGSTEAIWLYVVIRSWATLVCSLNSSVFHPSNLPYRAYPIQNTPGRYNNIDEFFKYLNT